MYVYYIVVTDVGGSLIKAYSCAGGVAGRGVQTYLVCWPGEAGQTPAAAFSYTSERLAID